MRSDTDECAGTAIRRLTDDRTTCNIYRPLFKPPAERIKSRAYMYSYRHHHQTAEVVEQTSTHRTFFIQQRSSITAASSVWGDRNCANCISHYAGQPWGTVVLQNQAGFNPYGINIKSINNHNNHNNTLTPNPSSLSSLSSPSNPSIQKRRKKKKKKLATNHAHPNPPPPSPLSPRSPRNNSNSNLSNRLQRTTHRRQFLSSLFRFFRRIRKLDSHRRYYRSDG